MALNLLRGPKNQIWQSVVVKHHDDMGKTYEDKFDILVRVPADMAELSLENEQLSKPEPDRELADARVRQYLGDNIVSWRNLQDTSKADIPFSAENLEDLIGLALYRIALITAVSKTRLVPAAAERKN